MAVADRNRWRLRLLDGCLQELEDAHEANLTTVPQPVADRVRELVPAVRPGMLISDAINLVLREQEQYVGDSAGRAELVSLPDDVDEPLDEAGARDLTERINRATRQVCMLVHEAHRRRAWLALGYGTWDQYVQAEFAISRTRSYELLDQGRVIRSLQAAAGISGIPDLSAYAAGQIKPYLPDLIEVVRERTVGVSEEDGLRIVVQAVRERRALIARERRAQEALPAGEVATELARLRSAIESLASMPPVDDVIDRVEQLQARRLARVDQALEWLSEFANEWRKRHDDMPLPSQGSRAG
jgi:hypothetical protein